MVHRNAPSQTTDLPDFAWEAPVEVQAIVKVRTRRYLVTQVTPPPLPRQDTLVQLACLEDDALGEVLTVLWERERDATLEVTQTLELPGSFDPPHVFAAYLYAQRWNSVTATDRTLLQAPYRAAIQVKDYQIEPLVKALQLPRVNLFIADDVGLGKTIEAGLIVRELLLRQRVRRILIACPPSVVGQWQDEMERRFGQKFQIFDRSFYQRIRRERGLATNPWATLPHFIISHALLRDETYASLLRQNLARSDHDTLLILDEAHHAAPSSGSQYAVDAKLTRLLRELAPLFEHKLFLSATPHNGHSNSFSALLELLDPQRFIRGVPVRPEHLDQILVRRLKSDLRELNGVEFPQRHIVRIPIDDLPDDAPELRLPLLLEEYRCLREQRYRQSSKSTQATAMLVVTTLQKRLLSSIEAFRSTLELHRKHVLQPALKIRASQLENLRDEGGNDDERAELDENQRADLLEQEIAAVSGPSAGLSGPSSEELALLDEMQWLAQKHAPASDPRLDYLLTWIRANLLLPNPNEQWGPRRLLIFSEYADTKNWLLGHLRRVSWIGPERVSAYHGGMGEESRQKVVSSFNADPSSDPLRILVATDAAREGINLQNHCAHLFHFDIPWNPSRIEQRNGRIDRKLQQAAEVFCHYFVFSQRAEDRVLQALVEKRCQFQHPSLLAGNEIGNEDGTVETISLKQAIVNWQECSISLQESMNGLFEKIKNVTMIGDNKWAKFPKKLIARKWT